MFSACSGPFGVFTGYRETFWGEGGHVGSLKNVVVPSEAVKIIHKTIVCFSFSDCLKWFKWFFWCDGCLGGSFRGDSVVVVLKAVVFH